MPKTCTVPGCSGPLKARGYCDMHYQRWKRRARSRKDVGAFTDGAEIDVGGAMKVGPGRLAVTDYFRMPAAELQAALRKKEETLEVLTKEIRVIKVLLDNPPTA